MLLIFCLAMTLHAVPTPLTPRAFVPLEKKGPLVWESAQLLSARGRARGGVNRLHVHAVDDQTNRVYAKQVRYFLQHAKSEQLAFGTVHERDVVLADYFSDSCYIFQVGVSKGDTLLAGFMQVFPEHRGRMPEAMRALGAWRRLVKGGEGGPLASESIAAIAIEMALAGALLPALALSLSEDCYLREQDWHQLTREDVFHEDGRVSMILGVRDRGLKVKTGSNQGVTLDCAYIADVLIALVASLEYGDAVFPFDPIQYVPQRVVASTGSSRLVAGWPTTQRQAQWALGGHRLQPT